MSTTREQIFDHLRFGDFETAILLAQETGEAISDSLCDAVLQHFHLVLYEAQAQDDYHTVRRMQRRIHRLDAFRNHGFDANALIPLVELPWRYSGKILLLSVAGGIIDSIVCLRADDLYHRDILRNAMLELEDLGLHSTSVRELGGAHLSWEMDDTLRIWGNSGQFGACDKEVAARLIRRLYPQHSVVIAD